MFPTSLPSFTTPSSSETLAAGGHTALHIAENSNIVAVATKIGTGASTPTSSSVLVGNGTGTSAWGQLVLSTMVTGILPTSNGGTGTTSTTGTGSNVFNNSPTLINPTESNGIYTSPTITNPTITGYPNNSIPSGVLEQNAVSASNLATNAITLGYTPVVNQQGSTSSATATQQTAFNTTVTIPSGGRMVEITVYIPDVFASSAGNYAIVTLWSGTFGSGNPINSAKIQGGSTGGNNPASPVTLMAVTTPSAGSITYTVGLQSQSGTAGWQSNDYTTSTAFLLVKAI
jgi:hypothetical protein